MPNLDLVRKDNLSSFRRIALGTWKTAHDPSVYGSLKLHVDETLRYMEEFRQRTGRRLTITHMMAKAMGGVLQQMPDANAILRFNNIYLRKDIAVFFQVAMKDDETGEMDLSGACIHHVDQKSLLQVVEEFQATVDKVRAKRDEALENTRSTFKKIPLALIHWVLHLVGTLAYTFNLDLRWAGIPRDPFGSVMVTNVGSLGLEEAYVPLVPYSRVPLLLAVGAITREAWLDENNQLVPRKTMKVFATFDHRLLDGSHAAHMAKTLKAWFERPYEHFGPIEDMQP